MKKIYYVFVMMLMAFLTLVAGFELYGIILNYGNPFASLFCGVLFFSSLLIFISFYIMMKYKNHSSSTIIPITALPSRAKYSTKSLLKWRPLALAMLASGLTLSIPAAEADPLAWMDTSLAPEQRANLLIDAFLLQFKHAGPPRCDNQSRTLKNYNMNQNAGLLV